VRARPVHAATVLGVAATVLLTGLPGTASAAAVRPGESDTSLNRAGYAVIGGVKNLSAGWKVPSVECHVAASYSSFRIGLARGAHSLRVGTSADCHHGVATYHAWIGSPSQDVGEVVKAGDLVRASISAPGHQVSVTLEDDTQGWGMASVSTSHATFTTAAVVVNARVGSAGVLPLADFGAVRFRARVDHQPLSAGSSNAVTMVSHDGTTLARPSALSPTGSFSVGWRHA
jgi:peptidase A4-like protein